MKRSLLLPILMLLPLLASCAVAPALRPAAVVAGKATVDRQPATGVRVEAYPATALHLSGAAPHLSAPTGPDGHFELSLPPGEYYFLARGEGLFSYYGRNPVSVPAAGLPEMNLGLVEPAEPGSLDPFVETGVAGRVLKEGQPLAGAVVFIYTDLSSGLKGMGYVMAGPTGPDGFFAAALPAGTYYLLARQRRGVGTTGPLRAGDFTGYYPENPVTVSEGGVARVAIPLLEVPDKVESLAGELFGATSIRGKVLDPSGGPVEGLRVLLYDDPQMLNRPLFVSQATGPDGAYVLSFPQGGTYYLAARDTLGGAPGPGDLYGTYDVTPDHGLEVETGAALEGIDLVVEEMW